MPRFVLLYHDCPPHYERPSHWDLMLEVGESLRTWALPRLPNAWKASRTRTAASHPDCPPLANKDAVSAEQLPDHRLDYLDNEGPLSGDRGQVTRIDRGTYFSEAEMPGCWRLTFAGGSCGGRITLQQTGPETRQWTLTLQQPPS